MNKTAINSNKIRNSLILLLTATIWGTSFVAQSTGMDYIGPVTFNGVRLLLGGITLLPVIGFLCAKSKDYRDLLRRTRKGNLTGGIICGIFLSVASTLQTYGIKYTTVGKAGFVTAFYIILVPIIALLFLKKRVAKTIWISVAVALVGLYLICVNENLTIQKGDFFVLLCSFGFALHILLIDSFVDKADGIMMSCIQFFVAGLLSLLCIPFFETPTVTEILSAWRPLLYSGCMSCGVGYTLQVIGQKGLNPSVASLIMSLESCISALSGWLILGQVLSIRELSGCGLMAVAIVMAVLSESKS